MYTILYVCKINIVHSILYCNVSVVYNSGTEVHVAIRSELRQHEHQFSCIKFHLNHSVSGTAFL